MILSVLYMLTIQVLYHLKKLLMNFFSIHGLSMASLQRQGYDGASKMQGEFNGLKALILRENESAFYIHCFIHLL